MKTKQCEISEKANARFGERYAGTGKLVWITGILLFGTALPAAAEQPIAGMEMKKEIAQAAHQGTGKVVSVNRAKSKIKLEHDAVKSLGWKGMMMDFNVTNAASLDGLKAGDAVTFELGKNTKTGMWQITRITPQGTKLPAVN